ncbi:hypothetical protein Pelo_3396 [Pelomyxa schiedti]|nr:hypothetical protein Pelo_3396 [Pelomyxa schiedti]
MDKDKDKGEAGPAGKRRVTVAVVGPLGCGKTALIRRWIDDRFEKEYIPSDGPDVVCCEVELEKPPERVQYLVFDIPGNEPVASSLGAPLYHTDAFILVFDSTNRQTLQQLASIKKLIVAELAEQPPPVFFVAGTKSDLIDKAPKTSIVTSSLISAWCKEQQIPLENLTATIESASSSSRIQVSSLFRKACEKGRQRRITSKLDESSLTPETKCLLC